MRERVRKNYVFTPRSIVERAIKFRKFEEPMPQLSRLILFAVVSVVALPSSRADQAKILTNHVGYEASGSKHAIIQGGNADNFTSCTLNDARDGS